MTRPPPSLWAYTYRLLPPQAIERLTHLDEIFTREHREALAREGAWTARCVSDELVSHILVISDSPALDGDANRRLEAELHALRAGFARTEPMRIGEPGVAEPPGVPGAD